MISDYRCNSCNKIFQVFKKKAIENFPINPQCPNCFSVNTNRIFSPPVISVCEGLCGNSKNGYSSGITYHPAPIMGGVQGKKIKKGEKYGKKKEEQKK